jgi:ribulose-bisphosphate carboxylase large chain
MENLRTPNKSKSPKISGDRFFVTYTLAGSESEARSLADYICNEETVEFPIELISDDWIKENILGRIETFSPAGNQKFKVTISYAVEITGFDLAQFLTIVFGNISLKPGIRVERFDLPAAFGDVFQGPRFGQNGWRQRLDVHDRPLLCTAIKPMGLDPIQLADMAYKFALGGIDIIKDDHGIANQPFCPYEERVPRCAEAVQKANQVTGFNSVYVPNITANHSEITARAVFAAENGAGGLLICPGITGFSVVYELSKNELIDVPIMNHPTFTGSNLISDFHGFSYYCLMGQLPRLIGADASIHASFTGRFAFTRDICQEIIRGCCDPFSGLEPIFPTPGGGMGVEMIPQLKEFYGKDVIYLIGGGLHRQSEDLVENALNFKRMVN